GTIYHWVINPGWWGHAARNWVRHGQLLTKQVGPWIWDSSLPAPPDVQVFCNVRPVVYSGEWEDLGERVKAELLRRFRRKGRSSVRNTFRFHGLLVCDECGYSLVKSVGQTGQRIYMGCVTKSRQKSRSVQCTQFRYISQHHVQAWFDEQFRQELDGKASQLFEVQHSADNISKYITEAERARDKNLARVQSLVLELADAPTAAKEIFRQQIATYSSDIDRDNERIMQWQRELGGQLHLQSDQARVIRDLKQHGIDWLWQQPDGVIHQFVSASRGDGQRVVRDGKIIGIAPAGVRVIGQRRRRHRK